MPGDRSEGFEMAKKHDQPSGIYRHIPGLIRINCTKSVEMSSHNRFGIDILYYHYVFHCYNLPALIFLNYG